VVRPIQRATAPWWSLTSSPANLAKPAGRRDLSVAANGQEQVNIDGLIIFKLLILFETIVISQWLQF